MKFAEPSPQDWAKMDYNEKTEIAHWYATQFLRMENKQAIAEVEWLALNLTPLAWEEIESAYHEQMKQLEDDGFFQ